VRDGHAAYGMAPVENSLAGSIHPVWDLLAAHTPPVVGEIYFHVKHYLIGHPGAKVRDIRRACSHTQALAQCAIYLQKLGIDAIEEYDTAGAVGLVKERGDGSEAAIAPAAAALLHDMEVLAENIQTHKHNYTRFLVLAAVENPAPEGALKSTLVFDLRDGASALAPLLASLADHSICKVETRKLADHPWTYRCYLECLGALEEDALKTISAHAIHLVQLTPYPLARQPAP
jgi:prephenate dehydratase